MVALLIIAVCLTGFVPEVRAAVLGAFNYFVEVFTDHIRIAPEESPDSEGTPVAEWEAGYELTWIPKDYILIYQDDSNTHSEQIYTPIDNKDIGLTFIQQLSSTYSISIDNETTTHEVTEINGYEAHLFYELHPDVPDEPESLCYNVSLIWQEENTTLQLTALDMSRSDIFRIAENIKPIRR